MTERKPRSTSASEADLRSYFLFADRLQHAIAKNRLDTAFEKKGRITYFADANLTLSYLLGEEEFVLSLRRLLKDDAARMSQDLTVKYILSGGLPGQFTPLLMSPPHWNEAVGKLDLAARRVSTEVAKQSKAAAQVLKDSVPELRELADLPDELISRAEELGLSELLTEIRQALGVNVRIAHAFGRRGPRIRGVEGLKLWNSVVNRTRNDDYSQWRASLTRHRDARTRKRDESRADEFAPERSRNLDADAQTLACIQALYRENPDAIGPDATWRFLFITSDVAILNAANEREKILEREGIPNFVREPLVYNPLINFSAMHNRALKEFGRSVSHKSHQSEELKKIFFQVEEAIAALFPSDELPRTVGRTRWLRHWKLQENVQRWSDAAETMGIVNAQLLTDEVSQPAVKEVAAIFAKENIAAAAGGVITSRIAEIKEDHALNMSAVAFDHIATVLASGGLAANEEARAPTKIFGVDLLDKVRAKVGPHFGPRTWAQLLDAIPSEENVPKITEAVSSTLRDMWDEPKGQLLASSIYLGVHAWESALACATRCAKLAPEGPEGSVLRREANYCRALSYRMMLRSEEDVRKAETLLSQNVARNVVDRVVRLRDAVERCTLLISACVVQAIAELNQLRDGIDETCYLIPDNLQRHFDDATRELSDIVVTFGEEFSGQTSDPDLVSKVVRQGAVNRLGAELLRHYLGPKLSHEPADLAGVLKSTKATLEVFGCTEPLPHPVTRGYMEVARYETGETAQAEVLSSLREILESKLLTDADEIEFKFIHSRVLRRRIASFQERAVA